MYAGGSFTKARPAGAAAGTNETPRSNLLAYDITTGADTGFAPCSTARCRSVAASPDGNRIYVGGDFTTINGGTRSRIAAFDTATGQADHELPGRRRLHGQRDRRDQLHRLHRRRLQQRPRRGPHEARRVQHHGGPARLGPTADNKVNALVLTPDGTKVVTGGAFLNLNGAAVYGTAAVDAATGALGTWKANSLIRNYGDQAAILALSTDGTAIYGNGYVYGDTGNLEGAFSANPADGSINWVEDCHGDSYGTYAPSNATDAVYVVSHAHYCGNVGGHPQTNPWTFQRGMAFTKQRHRHAEHRSGDGYYNFAGTPSPSIVSWFPQLAAGTYTGQSQAAWTVTGNDQYVVLGGEFPSVNGVAQQGLVRFAVQPIGKSTKPIYSGRQPGPAPSPTSAGGRGPGGAHRELGPRRLAADLRASPGRQGGQDRDRRLHLLEPAGGDRARRRPDRGADVQVSDPQHRPGRQRRRSATR